MASKKNIPLTGEVLHVTTKERTINCLYSPNAKLISPRIQLVAVEDIPQIRSQQILLPQHVYVGDVLLRHPYECDMYISADTAAYNIRFAKYCKIRRIAQLLGATGCVIEEAIEDIERRSIDANGNIKYEVLESSLDINSQHELNKTMGISVHNVFKGITVISAASYQEAQNLALANGLWEDPMVRSLIEMRSPSNENGLLEDCYHFNMTREANELLDVAFSLNVLDGLFHLGLSMKEALSKRETINLSIKFEFPN